MPPLDDDVDQRVRDIHRGTAPSLISTYRQRKKDAVPATVTPPKPASRARVSVIREERVYRPYGPHRYLRDLVDAHQGDPRAQLRLQVNNQQYAELQQRAGFSQTAGAGGEFVPPVYLIERFAPQLRAGRPFLNALGTQPVPLDGVKGSGQLNFPKFTTGATVAIQTDGATVSNADPTSGLITAQTQTAAGRSVYSWQYVDLNPYGEEVITRDLLYAYYTAQDVTAISSSVTNAKGVLNQTGVNTVTYTDATPTGPEFWAPVTQAAAQVHKNGAPPDFLLTHPSIAWMIAGSLDVTNNHPVFAGLGSGQTLLGTDAQTDQLPLAGGGDGLVTNVAGIPVCADPNVPTNLGAGTNESRVVVLSRLGFDVYESPPYIKIADQANAATGQGQLVAYGYLSILSRQPKLVTVISGTGLIPQTGWA